MHIDEWYFWVNVQEKQLKRQKQIKSFDQNTHSKISKIVTINK